MTSAESSSNSETPTEQPFWEQKSLEEMTRQEWESLCDGCGRCCLNKVEDWDTGHIIWTNLHCRLLDSETCRCSDYENRFAAVPECLELTAQSIKDIGWLPPTCAYARLRDGKPLLWWHPLISNDPETVHQAGISVRGRVESEVGIPLEAYEDYLADWPLEDVGEDGTIPPETA